MPAFYTSGACIINVIRKSLIVGIFQSYLRFLQPVAIRDMLVRMRYPPRPARIAGCLLLMLTMLAGCQQESSTSSAKPVSKSADASTPSGPPILEFWDNGNYLSGKVPVLLFAIWSDGHVVRQLGNGRLYAGTVSQAIVNQFAERVSLSGAIDPQIQVVAVGDEVAQLVAD